MSPLLLFCLLFTGLTAVKATAQDIPNRNQQIKAAVKAAPEGKRDGATVLGFNADNEIVVIREGTNEFVCLSDDPQKEGFSVACYHEDLEPFMARGRQLRAEGKGYQEVFSTREQEAKSGKLDMPDQPTTLHVLSGVDGYYDPQTDEVKEASLRWVVYIPFATAESTGLPEAPPAPGAPWIMFPGTHASHIMITPPPMD